MLHTALPAPVYLCPCWLGRHVIHTGIYMPFRQGTPLRLNLSYSLLPQYLRRCCNYSSHMVGKWHLGQNVLAALPTGRGFETYLGYWSGAEDYVTHDTLGAYDFNDDARHEAGSAAAEVTLRPAVELNGTYSTAAMTARAVRVIEGFGGGGGLGGSLPRRPLFLYLPYQAVHWPLEAPPQYVDRYRGRTGGDTRRQLVCAMAKALDDGVGQVTAALKRRGMWDDSLVLFSSDNGGPTNGNEGTWSSNFPLRGGKNTLWEGGTRVVGAVRGPGIPRGAASDAARSGGRRAAVAPAHAARRASGLLREVPRDGLAADPRGDGVRQAVHLSPPHLGLTPD